MPRKILIVEDNKDMQEVYRNYFDAHKGAYEIDIEGSAEMALKKAKGNGYDLIVLDIIMEPMTGESFLVYARENPKTKDVPILIVSVLSPDMLSQLKKYDKVEFMQKPVPEDKLIGTIDSMLA